MNSKRNHVWNKLVFFCPAMIMNQNVNKSHFCFHTKQSMIIFRKFLTLLQRSLWCLVGFEAEEGLLGPFCSWASFQVTYLTPLRPSIEGAVLGLRCNLGTLVSSISSSSSSSSSKLSWPSEFLSLDFGELGIGIFWHLKRILRVQRLYHCYPTKGCIQIYIIRKSMIKTQRIVLTGGDVISVLFALYHL